MGSSIDLENLSPCFVMLSSECQSIFDTCSIKAIDLIESHSCAFHAQISIIYPGIDKLPCYIYIEDVLREVLFKQNFSTSSILFAF